MGLFFFLRRFSGLDLEEEEPDWTVIKRICKIEEVISLFFGWGKLENVYWLGRRNESNSGGKWDY